MHTASSHKAAVIDPTISEITHLNMNFQSVQVTRGIAAVIVVWLHIGLMEGLWTAQVPHLMSPFVRLGHAGVDAFFIVSGFVLASAHWSDFGQGKVFTFLLKRLIRVYPYFLITSIPFLLLTYLEQHHFSGKTLSGLLLAPSAADLINPVAWSLAYEAVFYAAFACFLPLRRSMLVPGFIAWGLLIAVYNTSFPGRDFHDCRYVETLLHPLSLEFMSGVLMAALIKNRITSPPIPTIISAAIWLIIGCTMRHLGATDDFIFCAWRCVWFGIPCFLLIYGLISLELTGGVRRFPKLLLVLGNASYSIYLLHPLLLTLTRKWFTSLGEPISCLAASVGCAILFPALCIPFYYFVEKPLLVYCKKLLRFSNAVKQPNAGFSL